MKVEVRLQSRYVEYCGGKMVYSTEWRLHGPESCPVGCLRGYDEVELCMRLI